MIHFKKYTQEQFEIAVKSSFSKREALQKLGIAAQGGNYKIIDKAIINLKLDISHFKGSAWNKGKVFGPKRNIEKYLSNEHPIGSHKLRKRLIKEGLLEPKCSSCTNITWQNKPIPLELEHKNGNHEDNSLTNLCLLCPNCHALTSTYRGKNKKKS